MPLCERHNDLFAGKTHFQSSSVPSRQHRLRWQGIIILQSIIQSPPEPSNCMLQLIEVLIWLSESLQFFYCTEARMVKNLSWAKTDNVLFFLVVQWYRENLILLFSYHTHTPTDTYHRLSPVLITSVLDTEATQLVPKGVAFDFKETSVSVLTLPPTP